MTVAFLFCIGLLFGSFLNVISLRYNPDKFIFHSDVLGGRSRCPHCGMKLRWFELIPLVSFLAQSGLCRSCKKRLSLQYPVVELLSALVFVSVPWRLGLESFPDALSIIWIFVFLSLLLIALIDLRIRIIPDELNIFLLLLSLLIILLGVSDFNHFSNTYIGHYALLFGGRESIWLSHGLGFLFGFSFFMILVFLSRGRGMGGGDVKLGAALGFLFGWPDIAVLIPLSFIFGSLFAIPLLISGHRGRKDLLSFGPFLVLGASTIFLFGYQILHFYFSLFRI